LLLPSALVGFERLGAAMQWNFVETGFGNRQENAGVFLLQFKSDERHGLFRVIDLGIDGVRMPFNRKNSLGLNFLDKEMNRSAFIRLLHPGGFFIDSRAGNHTLDGLASCKGTVYTHTKPCPEFFRICYGTPDSVQRRVEKDRLDDFV